MIVVDTSALVAILKHESGSDLFLDRLASADGVFIGAPSKFELLLVMGRSQGENGMKDARLLLDNLQITVLDWTSALADIAADALLGYGKGRHPAKLNFGDCMAYAVAKALDAPLLFKGDDFALTDVKRVTG